MSEIHSTPAVASAKPAEPYPGTVQLLEELWARVGVKR